MKDANIVELVRQAHELRAKDFERLAGKYGVGIETVYAVARTRMEHERADVSYPLSQLAHSAIDAARLGGAAGFIYTYLQQSRVLIPRVDGALRSIITPRDCATCWNRGAFNET